MLLFLLITTVFLSAFFSSAETAYVSSNRLRFYLKTGDEAEHIPGVFLLKNARRFLTATLVGNNFVNISCSTLAIAVFSLYADEKIIVVFTTIGLLLFGEILPKSIAQLMPNRLIRVAAPILFFFYVLLFPLIKLAEVMSQIAVSFFKGGQSAVTTFFRKQDLPILLREYFSNKIIGEHDRLLISRAIKIDETRIGQIMVPRTEIFGLEHNTPVNDVYKRFAQTGFSRLPVYEDDLDNITGFLYFNDLLNRVTSIADITHPALFLPKTVSVVNAMNTLRKQRKSIAIVIDEHGGTAGLITMEDIVEEIFGSIDDEYDDAPNNVKKFNDMAILVSGRTEIKELNEKYELYLPMGEYVTVAGMLQYRLGYIPQSGEEFDFPGCKITITRATQTHIRQVFIKKKSVESVSKLMKI
jgi:putative hemolysin